MIRWLNIIIKSCKKWDYIIQGQYILTYHQYPVWPPVSAVGVSLSVDNLWSHVLYRPTERVSLLLMVDSFLTKSKICGKSAFFNSMSVVHHWIKIWHKCSISQRDLPLFLYAKQLYQCNKLNRVQKKTW